MLLTLTILLILSSLFGFFTAFKAKNLLSILIAIGFIISTILRYLSPIGLFYHSVALVVFSAIALTVLIFITGDRISSRHRNAALLVSIPFILVCTFKVLQLEGLPTLTLGLYLSPVMNIRTVNAIAEKTTKATL